MSRFLQSQIKTPDAPGTQCPVGSAGQTPILGLSGSPGDRAVVGKVGAHVRGPLFLPQVTGHRAGEARDPSYYFSLPVRGHTCSLHYIPANCAFVCPARLWASPGPVPCSPTAHAEPTHNRPLISVSGMNVCIAANHVINLFLISRGREPLVFLCAKIHQATQEASALGNPNLTPAASTQGKESVGSPLCSCPHCCHRLLPAACQ